MKTDPYLLERLRYILKDRNIHWEEKNMFGGVCFMVDDKMCFGAFKGGLMARVGTEHLEDLLKRDGASQMINGGREMRGYLQIAEEGYDMEVDLEFWIDKCLAFNPLAKSSKKKSKI